MQDRILWHRILRWWAALWTAGLIFGAARIAVGQEERATGFIRPPEAVRKAAYAASNARNGARIQAMAKMIAPPPKFDCVEMGWCPPIRDQGSCGSCYLVSTADAATCAFVKAGYGKPDDTFKISDQFGMDCHNFGGCGGGWGAEVIEWMCKNGFPAEYYLDEKGNRVSDYPAYEARTRACRSKSGAKLWKPADWGFCSNDSDRQATVAEIKAALMTYGTVNIAFGATGAYSNAGKNVVKITSRSVNHETTLVGWDDSKSAWKTRGNWGTGLGDAGYVWMHYDSYLVDVFWVHVPPITPPTPPDPGPTPPAPGNLTITPAIVTLAPGGTQQFQITPAGSYVWSASAGTVSAEGLYKAPASNGNYTVSANVAGDPTKYAIARVTVSTAPTPVEGATLVLTKPLPAGTYTITPGGLKEVPPMPAPEPEEKETEEPPTVHVFPPYRELHDQALKTHRPLVVGVSCEPPMGDWVSARVAAPFGDWKDECIIVGYPRGGALYEVATLRSTAGASSVMTALAKARKYNPATQETFQKRMNR